MLCHLNRPTLAAVLATLVLTGAAEASGRYRLPSNIPQFLGYGNGPGYHAPMVLGIIGGGSPPPRVRRVLHPPVSPTYHHHGFHAGATLIGGPVIHQHASHAWQPAEQYAPTPMPTPASQPRPRKQQPAPRRPGVEPRSPSNMPEAELIPLPSV